MYGIATITSKAKEFPFHIPLPEQLTIKGEVLLEHHCIIDLELREFKFVEKAPQKLIEKCSAKIKLLY